MSISFNLSGWGWLLPEIEAAWLALVILVLWGVVHLFLSSPAGLVYRRKIEAAIGLPLIRFGGQKLLTNAGLIKREIVLPDDCPSGPLTMHYYERPGENDNSPVLLLCHGMTSEAKNLSALVGNLAPGLADWRMICPDMIGHGHDLARVQKEGIDNFKYPDAEYMGRCIEDLLNTLGIQQCDAYGASLGGAVVYFLQHLRPQLVNKAILISPAVEFVLDPKFLEDFKEGRKNHFCFESRADVQQFMQDLGCPQRKKKDPIPPFLLEAVWQDHASRVPAGHFKKYFTSLANGMGQHPEILGATEDLAPTAKRLVLWPEDDFISNHTKGKAFFANSSSQTTTFKSIPDCGHLFHTNGQTVLVHTAPMMVEYLLKAED